MPKVNYLSLDIEGAEFQVLRSIPWNLVDIEVKIENDFCLYPKLLQIQYFIIINILEIPLLKSINRFQYLSYQHPRAVLLEEVLTLHCIALLIYFTILPLTGLNAFVYTGLNAQKAKSAMQCNAMRLDCYINLCSDFMQLTDVYFCV